jgi:hypothetical protein
VTTKVLSAHGQVTVAGAADGTQHLGAAGGCDRGSSIDKPKRALIVARNLSTSAFQTRQPLPFTTRSSAPMSNTDSLASITLRPWPAPAKDALSKEELSAQIHQLTVERGNLRGITEQALQAEIDAGKSLPDDGIEGTPSEAKKDGPATEEKMKELWEKRTVMYEKLE